MDRTCILLGIFYESDREMKDSKFDYISDS